MSPTDDGGDTPAVDQQAATRKHRLLEQHAQSFHPTLRGLLREGYLHSRPRGLHPGKARVDPQLDQEMARTVDARVQHPPAARHPHHEELLPLRLAKFKRDGEAIETVEEAITVAK